MADSDGYPAYLDEMESGEERTIRQRMDEMKAELESLGRQLDDLRRAKRILHVQGPDLEAELVRYLTEELHVPAKRVEGGPENFRVLDAEGKDWSVGDVASSAQGNVTKENVAAAMLHRAQLGWTSEASALLVVNTFCSGTTMEERDQPVPDDIVRRASEDNVVIVRTMDLVRLYQRATNGFPAAEQLTEALKSSGGWLEVDRSLGAKLHPQAVQAAA